MLRMTGVSLLAQAIDFTQQQLVTAGLWLAGALLVLAVLIGCLNRWRQMSSRGQSLGSGEQLAEFQRLHAQGLMSDDEFERVKRLLGGRLLREARAGNRTPEVPQPEVQPSRPKDRPPEVPPTGITPG